MADGSVPLIARSVLFGNPEKLGPQVSPDGDRLAYLAPDEQGVLQVWVRTIGGADDRVLTADPKRGIRSFFWTFRPDELIYLQDSDGDENFHLFRVHLPSRAVQDLTPFAGVRAQVIAVEPACPEAILVALNQRDVRRHDAYRIHLGTGALSLAAENPGPVIGWMADAALQVRAALASTSDGGQALWLRGAESQEWRTALSWDPDDQGAPLNFSADGKTLYLLGSHGANAQRLIARDVETGQERVLAEDPRFDVSGVLSDPTRRTPQAVAFYRDRLEWEILDPAIEEDLAAIRAELDGEIQIQRGDRRDRRWVVSLSRDQGPVRYFLYERDGRRISFLFSQRRDLEGQPLAPMRPIRLTARDGLTIHGYLSLPVRTEPRRLPAVLLVHGGPWARDRWGFNPLAQWLANRGYAVLQLNYRGSTGYGKKFLNAGNREWAGRMHDDLIDGVQWLVDQGIADPARIAIMGGSYGGYAALVGLTFTPEVFAAGVDIVGPSSLITLVQTIPPYWEPQRLVLARRLGAMEQDEAFLRSRSPLFFVDRIRKPLLIGQGANDPRVKRAESDQMVAALRKAGKPVEYLVYTDEGHGFARPENRMHFYARTEAFLAKYLGGRFEPAGRIEGHSGVER